MDKSLVSVILPFANAGPFLGEAIESVLAQTYRNWELLLVDDGGSDGSSEVAKEYAAGTPAKIHYLTHPDRGNHGVTRSRNRGIEEATGEFIAILDADDAWLPRMLETRVRALIEHPEASLAYGPSEYWASWNDAASESVDSIPAIAPGDCVYTPPFLFLHSHPFGELGAPCPSSFVMRREAARQIGGFVEEFCPATKQLYEDTAFLSKMYLAFPVVVGTQSLERYRIHPSSIWHRTKGTSAEEDERRFYFHWLRNYLRTKAVTDPRIWKAVRRKGWMYSVPLPSRVTHLLRRIINRLNRARGMDSRSRETD
ncbi:MAG TPA: glycosyltransferase [Terracidiphilus sp.]